LAKAAQRVGKKTRLCRLIFAPAANDLHIVFGEADPPSRGFTRRKDFQKSSLPLP